MLPTWRVITSAQMPTVAATSHHSRRTMATPTGSSVRITIYASEALPVYLAHLFERTGTERLESYVFADNPASLAVQRKFGAEVAGECARPSLARGHDVPGFDTVLTRDAFERRTGQRMAA